MRIRTRILLLAGCTLPAFAFANPVAAQGSDGAQASDENRIIVSARKRDEDLIDVPLPVTVATQEQLQRDQVYNLNDLQRIAPALEISQTSGGETNGGGRLRGIGTGVFNPSVASSVAFVVDQAPVGNLSFPLLYDLAQVEVLRGPQGTLFGAGASAGVLNISTRSPVLGEIGANASIDWADKGTAGSEVGEFVVNGGINVPLGNMAALRVATQYKNETGLQRSATTGEDNSIEDWAIRGKLLVEFSDSVTATFSAEHAQNTTDGQTFFAIAVAPNSAAPFGPPGGTLGGISNGAYTDPNGCGVPVISERAEFYCEEGPTYLETNLQAYSAVFDVELSDELSLTSVSAYRDRTFKQFRRDFSRITGTFAARQERTQENADGFSQELRLSYIGDSFDLVFGGFYQDYGFDRVPIGSGFVYGSALPDERVGFSVCQFPGVPRGPAPFPCAVNPQFTKETTNNRTYAAFADATVQVTDTVSIFGGLRFDDYKNTTTVQQLPAVAGDVGGLPGQPATFITTDSALSGRIGVSYRPNPDTNIFASYSRGYKPPAVGTDPAGMLFQLQPEKTNAFELGAKTAMGGLQLSGNVFYSELINFQSQRSRFVGTALISEPINVPKLESYGLEVNAFGEVFEGFNVNAGYQFNILEYPSGFLGDDAADTDGDGVADDNITPGLPFVLGGTQFLNAPKHKFTLSGDYGIEVSDGVEFFINANLVYKSKVLLASRADPRYRYPAHELINGGLGVRDPEGSWNASIFVRNLTKEREPTAMLASTFAGQADGGIRYWPVAGLTARVVGVRIGFEY